MIGEQSGVADCRFQISDFRLQIERKGDCGFRISDCGLQNGETHRQGAKDAKEGGETDADTRYRIPDGRAEPGLGTDGQGLMANGQWGRGWRERQTQSDLLL